MEGGGREVNSFTFIAPFVVYRSGNIYYSKSKQQNFILLLL